MAEFVPDRIYKVNKEGPTVSSGTLLYADISGFTRMSEKLATLGPAGTEELTTILNDYFGEMLEIIKEYDGEVLKIIGDAIVAAFYGKDLETGKKCAESMIKATQRYKKIATSIGTFELGAKIVGSNGEWLEFIAGDRRSADLFLSGSLIKHLATMEKNAKKGEVLFENVKTPSPPGIIMQTHLNPLPEYSFYDKNIQSLVNLGIKGEHRVITSLFIYFTGYDENKPDIKDINGFLSNLFSIVEKYNGRLHIIDNLTEEGTKLLFLFGVPRSYGNDIMNATQALLEISKINSEFTLKAAVNTGFGYAGIITGEKMNFYTTIGDTVNTAARLAESAKWGEFVTSLDVYRSTFHKIAFKEKEAVVVKGKKGPQRRFTPLRIRKEIEERFPFVGRENLLSDLKLYLEKTNAVITVEGEPGSGKTRLLREFFKRLSLKNLIFMRFDHTKPSFSAFKEMFAREAGILETDPIPIIKEKLHDLLVKTDIYDGELLKREEFIGTFLFNLKYESGIYDSVSPRIRWQNLQDAIRLFFRYRAMEEPLTVWTDDLHEASREEEELIIYILRAIYADREYKNVRFFFSRRDVSKISFPPEIPVKIVRVGPLTFKETSRMLDAIFKRPAHDELYEEIYRKTEGIPFFVEQYALLLMEKGLLREKEGKYFIPEHAREVMPENIFTVIMERVDRLEEKIKEKLRIGSVIGMKFPKKPLYIISNDSSLEQELETITNEHLVYPDEGELEEIEYIFSHAYLRDVIYRSILIKKKKELHREIARVFEEIYADKLEQLYDTIARHYHSGDEVEKALHYYLLAAKRAKSLFNNSLAYEDFKRAEEIIHKYLPESTEKLYDVYMHLAELARIMGKSNETNEYLGLAIKTATKLGDRTKELNARIDLIEAQLYSGKGEELIKEIEGIINETQDKNLKDILARAYLVKTEILTYRGEYKDAILSADTGIELFSELDNPLKLAYSYKNRGLAYKESGDIEKALRDYKTAYEIFKKENYLLGIAGMHNNMGTIYFALGDFKNALSHFREAHRIWKNIGDVENSAGILINIGACYESMDKKDEAMKSYEESLKIFKEIGHLHGISILTFNMGHLRVRENKIGEALSLFKESFEIRKKLGNNPGLVNVGKLIVEYLAFLGDTTGALNYFYKIEKVARLLNAPEVMAVISEIKVKLMREGIIHLDIPLETTFIEQNLQETTGDYMARYIYALMVLKMMQGMKEESEELYNKALNIKDASEEILWYLKREYGLLLTLNGNSEQAVEHYIKLKELPVNTIEKIKINTELYRLTGNTEYLDEAKRDILTLLLNLPDNLKKTFVNKPGIKKILKA